jgi:excinuclease ABC subunit B
MTPEQLKVKLKQLEQQMHKHARDLEFEQAAKLRDEILQLRRQGLELPAQQA